MKKMTNLLVIFILIGLILPVAYADTSNNNPSDGYIDKETQQQTEIMNNKLGAEIRLLQLEKAIIRNIEKGEQILLFINESDIDSTNLQVILAEFDLLLEEVQHADYNSSEAVSIFVDLKHDAINLSKEFREIVHGLFTNSMYNQIRQKIRNMTCNQTQNLSNSIKNKIRQYNSDQFLNICQLIGENHSREIVCYQNGSMTQKQMKHNITHRFNQTDTEKQFNFITSLKQQKIRDRIQSQNQVQNASEGFQQRQENRFQRRLQRIEDFPDNPLYNQLMMRMQNKLNDIDDPGVNGPNNGGYNDNSGNGQKGPGYGDNGGSNKSGGGN